MRAGHATSIRPAVVLLGVLAVGLNLRAALAGYPPVLPAARAALGISAGAAGLVQAGVVLTMAVGSLTGPALGARIGAGRALGVGVGLIALGSVVRGVAALWALIGGSVLIGLGIGVAGVLLTGVVKEHLADRAGAATGGYVVAQMAGATVASAVAVPLATLLGGWARSLAVWALPALVAVVVWAPLARRTATAPPGRLPWRDPFARLAACYQAGTSTLFYGWLTWLAPYYVDRGWNPARAGLLLAVWSIAQVPAALLAPALAERHRRWRFWSGSTLAAGVVGTLGALLLPEPPLVGPWVWAVLMGIGVGAGFPLGLAVIAWRTPDARSSAATSGLALGVGFTAAGLGPLVMGVLIDVTGGFPAAIAVLLAAGALQAWAITRIGDRR